MKYKINLLIINLYQFSDINIRKVNLIRKISLLILLFNFYSCDNKDINQQKVSQVDKEIQLVSDALALQKADSMITKLGGHQNWANAKHLYVREKVFHIQYPDTIVIDFWRNYEEAAYHSIAKSSLLNREEFWNTKEGWRTRNNNFQKFSDDKLKMEIAASKQEPYSIYNRLAKKDTNLIVKLVDNNKLDFYEKKTGQKLCWIKLNIKNEPVLWGNIYDGGLNEHIYGPLKNFGLVNMPAWGGSINGDFRFEYVIVEPKESTMETPISPK
jgi:hypothetical protein